MKTQPENLFSRCQIFSKSNSGGMNTCLVSNRVSRETQDTQQTHSLSPLLSSCWHRMPHLHEAAAGQLALVHTCYRQKKGNWSHGSSRKLFLQELTRWFAHITSLLPHCARACIETLRNRVLVNLFKSLKQIWNLLLDDLPCSTSLSSFSEEPVSERVTP